MMVRAALVAVWLLAASATAWAQTPQAFEEYGVGPRDSAMGNSFTAVADDYAAAFYNPAGLNQVEGTHVSLGYRYLAPRVTAKMPRFAADKFTQYSDTAYGLFGLASDLNAPSVINPKYTERLSFGTAMAISGFVHSYTNYYDPHTPYFYRYNDRPVALLSVYVSAGVKLFDWWSIGGGFVTAPSYTYASARVRTDVYLPEGNSVSKQATVNRAYGVIEPVAGMLFRIPILDMPDRLRIGLSWRDEEGVVDGKGYAANRIIVHIPDSPSTITPIPNQNVPIDTLSGFSPMQATLGLSCRFADGNVVSADAIWKQWSRFQMYFLMTPDPPFHDTFEERLGVEQRFDTDADWLDSWAVRAGWYYEPSPAPSQNGVWNVLDNDKHVFSTGFNLRLDRVIGLVKTPINLDGSFQLHYLVPQTITNDQDPDFPKIETGGLVYVGAGTIEVEW